MVNNENFTKENVPNPWETIFGSRNWQLFVFFSSSRKRPGFPKKRFLFINVSSGLSLIENLSKKKFSIFVESISNYFIFLKKKIMILKKKIFFKEFKEIKKNKKS